MNGIGIADMAKCCGLSPDTLRWYEKDGILPPVPRGNDGRRIYTEADVALVQLLATLRRTGMTTSQMREFVCLLGEGAASHGRRIALLNRVQEDLTAQRAALDAAEAALTAKIAHYERLIAEGLDCQGEPVDPTMRAHQRARSPQEVSVPFPSMNIASVPTRTIPALGREVGALGYGAMGLSWAYTSAAADDRAGEEVIQAAIERGITMIDTSNAYANGRNEQLVGRAIAGRRSEAVIATKAGLVDASEGPKVGLVRDGRPDQLLRSADESLTRLGVDHIDLFYLHRVDPAVPLEESWGALAQLVTAGKVRALGLSEVSVQQAEVAQNIHPVAAIQSELSLWTRDPLGEGSTSDGEPAGDVVGWCREHDAIFVPFSPLGRGFLTGAMQVEDLDEHDLRRSQPRFASDARVANQRIVDVVAAVAARHGVTPAVIALTWVLAQGPHVIPIPGTSKIARLDENLAATTLTLNAQDFAELNGVPAAKGSRY